MTMQTVDPSPRKHLPVFPEPEAEVDVDAELRAFEQEERQRLHLDKARSQWVDTMLKPKMKRKERDHVTLLISGLTAAQDTLVEGALRGLGYKVQYFGMSNNDGLRVGKEFGNRGQCNPTYFTVGSLVNHLIHLRDEKGLTAKQVVEQYVFVTAGACGPCRFGMYVTEYRKALRDAGFDGFRVMLFQQTGGLTQATGEDVGLEMNPAFFVGILKAIVSGDVLNALAYRIRPYEVEKGATDRAVEEAKRVLYHALEHHENVFLALYKARKFFTKIKVDKLRVRPKASIIGEFWAMTTEGDGNYGLQRFIESEGGENDIQLVTAWLLYVIWEGIRDSSVRSDLRGADKGKWGLAGQNEFGLGKRLAMLRVADTALRLGFQAFALPLGLNGYHLPDMDLIAKIADEHYSNDLRGGEGHMEVGKLIVNSVKSKAHLTVSVKPFGCMPSSGVSDGVQSLVASKFPGSIFCAVETSGDGATNFYSRVQMYMFKARQAAEQELERALTEMGTTREEVQAFLDQHPKYKNPLHRAPHRVAGSAANLVYEVAPLLRMSTGQRLWHHAVGTAKAIRTSAEEAPKAARRAFEFVASPETRKRLGYDLELVGELVQAKATAKVESISTKVRAIRGPRAARPPVVDQTPEYTGFSGEQIAAE